MTSKSSSSAGAATRRSRRRTSASSADADFRYASPMDARRRMVAEQIRARGVVDRRVLDAMEKVPRELFIPKAARGEAHEDRPVPIGFGVTISQPYIVGYMTEALKVEASHRVLEIGTGCGYQTAVLAELAAHVYSIEVIPELADRARDTVQGLSLIH